MARPTSEEAADRARLIRPTAEQAQHAEAARTNPNFRASINQGKPSVAATSEPGKFTGKNVVTAKGAEAVQRPAPERPAPQSTAEQTQHGKPTQAEPRKPAPVVTPKPAPQKTEPQKIETQKTETTKVPPKNQNPKQKTI